MIINSIFIKKEEIRKRKKEKEKKNTVYIVIQKKKGLKKGYLMMVSLDVLIQSVFFLLYNTCH
jgi:hypothetical protein